MTGGGIKKGFVAVERIEMCSSLLDLEDTQEVIVNKKGLVHRGPSVMTSSAAGALMYNSLLKTTSFKALDNKFE